MKTHIALAVALICLAPTTLWAAIKITTQDGTVISGDLVSMQNGIYTIKTPYGTQTVPQTSVKAIENDNGGTPASSGPLRLAGSTTIGDDLAPALLEAFAATKKASDVTWTQEGSASEQLLEAKDPSKPDSTFTAHVSRHGSGTAFTALADGKADIGMASRRIQPEEAAKLAAARLGDLTQPGSENVLALDGIIIVVNRANPVNTLTISQLHDIFSGKITDWSQVGGTAGPIHLVGRDSKSGTADTFKALVMGGGAVVSSLNAVDGAEGVALKVQGDAGAIGYTGFAYLGDNKAVSIGTECGLEYPASDLYVRTEEYPLSRRLYLYKPDTPTNVATVPFIDFALSGPGQALARKKNFIDLEPRIAAGSFGRNALALDLAQLADDRSITREDVLSLLAYSKRVVNGNRVSTTFRFQSGSSALDARAVRDIDRLVDFLKSQDAKNRNVLIAGFADSVGSPSAGRRLATDRARQIAALLHGKGIDVKDVVGYGRIAPVACNTTPEGRQKNRRVEVWLY